MNVQVSNLISSPKTYHPTLRFTPSSLDLFIRVPFQLHGEHTVLQPIRRIELIVHIVISVLLGILFHLSQVKHLRVKDTTSKQCPNIERRETWYFSENPAPSGARNRTAGSDISKVPRSNHCAMSLSNLVKSETDYNLDRSDCKKC